MSSFQSSARPTVGAAIVPDVASRSDDCFAPVSFCEFDGACVCWSIARQDEMCSKKVAMTVASTTRMNMSGSLGKCSPITRLNYNSATSPARIADATIADWKRPAEWAKRR